MTPKQVAAMAWLRNYTKETTVKWATSTDCLSTPGVMASLVRAGYARSVTQTERPIGQGTIRYGWYQATIAGIAAYEAQSA